MNIVDRAKMSDRHSTRKRVGGSTGHTVKRLLNSGKLLALLIAGAGVFAAASAMWSSTYGTLFLVLSIILISAVAAIVTHKIRRIAIAVRDVKNELIKVRTIRAYDPRQKQTPKDQLTADTVSQRVADHLSSDSESELRELSERVEEISRGISEMALSVPSHVHPKISSLTVQTLQMRMRHTRPRSLTYLDHSECETLVSWLASVSPNHIEVTAFDAQRNAIELAVAEVLVVDLTGYQPEEVESIQTYGQLIGRNEVWIIGNSSLRNIVVQKIRSSDRSAELVVVGDEKIELTIMRKGN